MRRLYMPPTPLFDPAGHRRPGERSEELLPLPRSHYVRGAAEMVLLLKHAYTLLFIAVPVTCSAVQCRAVQC